MKEKLEQQRVQLNRKISSDHKIIPGREEERRKLPPQEDMATRPKMASKKPTEESENKQVTEEEL